MGDPRAGNHGDSLRRCTLVIHVARYTDAGFSPCFRFSFHGRTIAWLGYKRQVGRASHTSTISLKCWGTEQMTHPGSRLSEVIRLRSKIVEHQLYDKFAEAGALNGCRRQQGTFAALQ